MPRSSDTARPFAPVDRALVNTASVDTMAFWASNGMSPHECTYCGAELNFLGADPDKPTMQADHIIARVKGGSDRPENLAPSCPKCNRVKKDRSLVDFLTVPSRH